MEPPLGWHFKESGRLALVSFPSGRDIRAGNSQVSERIGIHLLEKIARNGMAILVLKRKG